VHWTISNSTAKPIAFSDCSKAVVRIHNYSIKSGLATVILLVGCRSFSGGNQLISAVIIEQE